METGFAVTGWWGNAHVEYHRTRVQDVLEERVAYENRLRATRGYPLFERPLRPLPFEEWPIEYLIAAIQSGSDLSYEEAIAEVCSLFERLDP